mmetsp:Transcript_21060/g.44696  ORF Transcript_21060/g.44696 Transcript_21060/m.44696 type:complete len:186 (-) Transcript_21060:2269-2826(-)
MIVRQRKPQRRLATCKYSHWYIATISAAMILCLSSVYTTTAFVGRHRNHEYRPAVTILGQAAKDNDAVAPMDNAAAITDFMAKAHEEKINAMARVEDKYKGQIAELQDKISELEALNKQTTPTSGNSFAFPATNKDMTDKVQAYRTFISDYIVKSQEEKAKAVYVAESKLTAKYEAIIAALKLEK